VDRVWAFLEFPGPIPSTCTLFDITQESRRQHFRNHQHNPYGWGWGFYAAQSFSDIPDGRRLLIGWWHTETKGMPFNQSMSLPLELALTQTNDGPRLTFSPAKELQTLRERSHQFQVRSLRPGGKNPRDAVQAELLKRRIEFEPGEAQQVVFNIRDVMMEYNTAKQGLSVAGHREGTASAVG
jgi:fructan beta-fructosidase